MWGQGSFTGGAQGVGTPLSLGIKSIFGFMKQNYKNKNKIDSFDQNNMVDYWRGCDNSEINSDRQFYLKIV